MSGVTEFGPLVSEYRDVHGRTIHLWRAGSGPPVLLLHGFADDGACWVSTASLFIERGMQVVAPDARAHGSTALRNDDDFTAAARMADTEALLEVLDLEHVVAVGHSMGAITAMKLASGRKGLIAAAILVDPPLFGFELDPMRDEVNLFQSWIDELTAMPPAELAERCRRENPEWTPDEVTAWVSSKRSVDRQLFERSRSWHGESWRSTIAAIECPLLVVAGEVESDSAVDVDAGEWLEEASTVEFVRVRGAGHSVHRDRREAFTAVVSEFLDRLNCFEPSARQW